MIVSTEETAARFSTDIPYGTLSGLVLRNLVLSILTLGFYRFWGKADIRRLLWSHTLFQGERFDYTGTGGELFKGFLVVLVVVLLPLVGLGIASQTLIEQGRFDLGAALAAFQTAILVALPPIAVFRALRYRYSRTRWRGIRPALTGSTLGFAWRTVGFWFVLGLSLGLTYPVQRTRLWGYLWNRTRFGDQPFGCDAGARPLYPTFLVSWSAIVSLIVVGIAIAGFSSPDTAGGDEKEANVLVIAVVSMAFMPLALLAWTRYRAAELRHLLGHLSFAGFTFAAEVRTWELFRLALVNVLITVPTLGIMAPLATARTVSFLCARLSLVGEGDFAAISQSLATAPTTGEGMVDAFDVDVAV